ncbi:MAG: ATP-binding protein [Actinoplanes sp.]
MNPPYLFDRLGADEHSAVTATVDLDTAVVLLTVRGMWDGQLRRVVSTGVRKCLSEHPAAIIFDLSGVADPEAGSVATWVTVDGEGRAMQPPVQILFCVAADSRLARRLRVFRRVSLFAGVEEARSAASRLAGPDRLSLLLSPDGDAPRLARVKVTEGCVAWGLPSLVHRGRLVVSELVANAAEHARTAITVLVSRRAEGLHLIVADGDPRLPCLLPPWPAPGSSPRAVDRGHGLRLVDAAATVWGAMPAGDGKMVWATLYRRPGTP